LDASYSSLYSIINFLEANFSIIVYLIAAGFSGFLGGLIVHGEKVKIPYTVSVPSRLWIISSWSLPYTTCGPLVPIITPPCSVADISVLLLLDIIRFSLEFDTNLFNIFGK
jgi:hypothetical protein